jgi:hypothetical protein
MVNINGTTRQIQVGRSHSGAIFPSAVLDSGVPLILTTTAIANGIYGALGINPAQDGMCAFSFFFFCLRYLSLLNLFLIRLRAMYYTTQHDYNT